MSYDILIATGKVVDGTGNPWFLADIGIQDGRVAALGSLDKSKTKRVVMEEPAMMEFTPQHYAACFVQENKKLKEDKK